MNRCSALPWACPCRITRSIDISCTAAVAVSTLGSAAAVRYPVIIDGDQRDRSPAVLDVGSNRDLWPRSDEVIDGPLRRMGLDDYDRVVAVDWFDHPAGPRLGFRRLDAGPQTPHRHLQQQLGLVVAAPGAEQAGELVRLWSIAKGTRV